MPSTGGSVADEGGGGPVPIPGPTEDNTFVDAGTSGFVDPRQDAAVDVRARRRHRVVRRRAEPARPGLPAAAGLGPGRGVGQRDGVRRPRAHRRRPRRARRVRPGPGLDDGTQLVRVGVSAREVEPTERPRVNVTLVVDRSGSMDIRNRLGLVQSSLALLADRLAGDDTVSVVSFEDQARPILEPTPVRDTGKILDAIEELEPGGSTNLEAGLRLGYEQARRGLRRRRRQPRRARLRRRRQRRRHRARLDHREDRRGGPRRHPPGDSRLRHGQLQRPPDGAARRPRATASTPTSTPTPRPSSSSAPT